jgi:hypothetical protein
MILLITPSGTFGESGAVGIGAVFVGLGTERVAFQNKNGIENYDENNITKSFFAFST